MKKLFILTSMLFLSLVMFGQAREGWVEVQKKQQQAAVIELPYSTDIVNAAMNDHLSRKGRSKVNDLKGFTTYRNTQPSGVDSVNADMYFKVERKSRQEKGITLVSLLINGPETKVVNVANQQYLNMEQAKLYLNELEPAIAAYNLELDIKDQNDAVAKSEARLKSLRNEGEDLEQKLKNIEKKIQENKASQQKQIEEVEMQKQKLGQRVGERKS